MQSLQKNPAGENPFPLRAGGASDRRTPWAIFDQRRRVVKLVCTSITALQTNLRRSTEIVWPNSDPISQFPHLEYCGTEIASADVIPCSHP
jgi:hypothetical protein